MDSKRRICGENDDRALEKKMKIQVLWNSHLDKQLIMSFMLISFHLSFFIGVDFETNIFEEMKFLSPWIDRYIELIMIYSIT